MNIRTSFLILGLTTLGFAIVFFNNLFLFGKYSKLSPKIKRLYNKRLHTIFLILSLLILLTFIFIHSKTKIILSLTATGHLIFFILFFLLDFIKLHLTIKFDPNTTDTEILKYKKEIRFKKIISIIFLLITSISFVYTNFKGEISLVEKDNSLRINNSINNYDLYISYDEIESVELLDNINSEYEPNYASNTFYVINDLYEKDNFIYFVEINRHTKKYIKLHTKNKRVTIINANSVSKTEEVFNHLRTKKMS